MQGTFMFWPRASGSDRFREPRNTSQTTASNRREVV
jgi:hypothetical protein